MTKYVQPLESDVKLLREQHEYNRTRTSTYFSD